MHSPIDTIVGIENASTIFTAAKHPKSFISLDNADHLITRRDDAAYRESTVIVTESPGFKFRQVMAAGPHPLTADESRKASAGTIAALPLTASWWQGWGRAHP